MIVMIMMCRPACASVVGDPAIRLAGTEQSGKGRAAASEAVAAGIRRQGQGGACRGLLFPDSGGGDGRCRVGWHVEGRCRHEAAIACRPASPHQSRCHFLTCAGRLPPQWPLSIGRRIILMYISGESAISRAEKVL